MNAPDPSSASARAPAGSVSASRAEPRLGRWVLVVLVLVAAAAIAGWLPRTRARAELEAVTKQLAVPSVLVVKPAAAPPTGGTVLPAELRALTEAPIHARASGYLKRWLVDLGAVVEAGQLLAEIETPELDQELARSRAELAQAEAAEALARTTAARWVELLKTASVSEQETAERQADLALKSATVQAARANVLRLQNLQGFARVTAPFAGTITARHVDVGELVTAGSGRELFRLADTRRLRVYVRVPQTAAQGVQPGQAAEVTVPERPGRVFPAKVVRSAGAMDASSRTLLVELEVENPQGALLSGSFAQVRLTEAVLDAAITVPSNALLFRSEGTQVGVVGRDDKVELRKVTLGRDFGPIVEVLNGVTTNEQVILNPSDSLVSGVAVRIVTPPPGGPKPPTAAKPAGS